MPSTDRPARSGLPRTLSARNIYVTVCLITIIAVSASPASCYFPCNHFRAYRSAFGWTVITRGFLSNFSSTCNSKLLFPMSHWELSGTWAYTTLSCHGTMSISWPYRRKELEYDQIVLRLAIFVMSVTCDSWRTRANLVDAKINKLFARSLARHIKFSLIN